jgi:hypothetical protein
MDFVKYDSDKLMVHLVEPSFIEGMAAVLTHGARKYSPNNWTKCTEPFERYYSALQRHLLAYAQARDTDPESGLPHLHHAACCLMFLAWHDEQPQVDDLHEKIAEAMQQRIDALDELTQQAEDAGGYVAHMPHIGLRDPSHP